MSKIIHDLCIAAAQYTVVASVWQTVHIRISWLLSTHCWRLHACHDSAPKILSLSTPGTRAGTQVPSTATPSPAVAATDSIGDLTACVKITQKAVDLTLTLLELHRLSQQSSPEVSSAQPAQDQALPMNNDSPASSTARTAAGLGAQAQAAPPLSETWPTPKPSQWLDIELVATQPCHTLRWALSSAAKRHVPAETLHSLAARLCLVIQRLVIGHLQDLDLSVYKLFVLGLEPVLNFHLQGDAEDTSLAVAMLSRLATDCNVIPVGCIHASEICYIHCKSDGSKTLVCRVVLAARLIQAEHLAHMHKLGSWFCVSEVQV